MTPNAHFRNIFQIEVTDISKNKFKLEKFKGNVLLIVNIATLCGLSEKSLGELSILLVKFKSKGLKVLLFPCDNLLIKKSTIEVKNHIARFSDDFILMDEVQATGAKIHPLFQFLNSKDEEHLCGSIKHNFTYFLIDRNGNLIKKYLPTGKLVDSDPDLVRCIGDVSDKAYKIPFQRIWKLNKNFESDSEE